MKKKKTKKNWSNQTFFQTFLKRYEGCRKVLESCDEVKDVQLFIQTKCTGTTKPGKHTR